jgi:hypothetical protein
LLLHSDAPSCRSSRWLDSTADISCTEKQNACCFYEYHHHSLYCRSAPDLFPFVSYSKYTIVYDCTPARRARGFGLIWPQCCCSWSGGRKIRHLCFREKRDSDGILQRSFSTKLPCSTSLTATEHDIKTRANNDRA